MPAIGEEPHAGRRAVRDYAEADVLARPGADGAAGLPAELARPAVPAQDLPGRAARSRCPPAPTCRWPPPREASDGDAGKRPGLDARRAVRAAAPLLRPARPPAAGRAGTRTSTYRVHYPEALWGRGTRLRRRDVSAGDVLGGRARGPVAPGVYHYSTAHHALERLLTGDVTGGCARPATAGPGTADRFLLVAVRFWKNSFKYNSFCYHVVTQDAGAMLGSWELVARGLGRPLRRVLWFADERLDALLGLDTWRRASLAVVPLPLGPRGRRPGPPSRWARPPGRPAVLRAVAGDPAVRADRAGAPRRPPRRRRGPDPAVPPRRPGRPRAGAGRDARAAARSAGDRAAASWARSCAGAAVQLRVVHRAARR